MRLAGSALFSRGWRTRNVCRPSLLVPLTRRRTMSSSSTAKDFEVPVPWGKIAGKEWGDPGGPAWIALHGWLDNCGSFDTMAPGFPGGHRLLCVDVPGHGLSSHNPPGVPYHFADGLQVIRRVAGHFSLDRFSLLGHSMGAGMALLFAATHPEMVERLIMLDVVGPAPRSGDEVLSRMRAHVDTLLDLEEKIGEDTAPAYSMEEAKQRLMAASSKLHRADVITEESCEVLLRRGVVPSRRHPGKFEYTRDLRHTIPGLYGFPLEYLFPIAKAIKCPHLIITANCASYPEMRRRLSTIVEVYKESNGENFTHLEVEGTHHVHLNNPERVLEPIGRFLDVKKGNL